ncbi:MAG TPA: IgGFc-binding protein [Polyangia bacterium]|jgi:hypothetical protein
MARTITARATLVALFVLPLGLAQVGCGPTAGGVDGDGGPIGATCTTADHSYCDNTVHHSCVGGHWKTQDCGSGVCVAESGCQACLGGTKYCEGSDVYECNADGSSGTYLSTCAEFEKCVLGGCLSACADLTRSNVGCEFWAIDLPNDYQCISMNGGATCDPITYGCGACQQFAVVVTNTSDFVVNVKVELNNAGPGEPLALETVEEKQVGPRLLAIFNLPMREVDCTEWYTDTSGKMRRRNDTTTCLSSKAYRVTSDYPIVAYQFNPIVNVYSNAASLLIPTNGLDTDYYVLSWSTTNPIKMPIPGQSIEGIPDYMNVTIAGVYPGTHVQVTTAHQTQGSPDGGVPVAAASAGETITVNLGPFDVLNIESRQDLQHPTGDFTGTRVVSDYPVAVFSGGQRSIVPDATDSYNPPAPAAAGDLCCTEHFEQQMFPVSSLGTKFVITRSPIRSTGAPEPDFYRILATKPGTVVTTNLANFPTLNIDAGKYARLWATEDFTIISNEPIMIAQYIVSEQYMDSYNTGGDGKYILFPPAEQHRPTYVFLVPTTFPKDYVVIAAPEGTQVLLDGTDVGGEITSLCEKHPAGILDTVSYNAIRCPVEDGPHTIDATDSSGAGIPVGISVYGYGNVSSYAYPGGADVKQINMQ